MSLPDVGYIILSSSIDVENPRKTLQHMVFNIVFGDPSISDGKLLTDMKHRMDAGYPNKCTYRNGNTKEPKISKTTGAAPIYLDLELIHARSDAAEIIQDNCEVLDVSPSDLKYYRKMDNAVYKPIGSTLSAPIIEENITGFLCLSADTTSRVNKGSFRLLAYYSLYRGLIDMFFPFKQIKKDKSDKNEENKKKRSNQTKKEPKSRTKVEIPLQQINELIYNYTMMYHGKTPDDQEWAATINATIPELPFDVPEDPYLVEWVTPDFAPGDILVFNCPYRLERNDKFIAFSGLYISLSDKKADLKCCLESGWVNDDKGKMANIEEREIRTGRYTRPFQSLIPCLTKGEKELYGL